MNKKIYMAGPLFTSAEVKERIEEWEKLTSLLKELKSDYELFSPIKAPFNNSKAPTSQEIFEGDRYQMNTSGTFFFELSNEDPGTVMELGMVLTRIEKGEKLNVYPIYWDIRLGRENPGSHKSPVGFNQFVIGGLESHGIKIHSSFADALEAFKKQIKK